MAEVQHPFCEDGFVYLIRPGDTLYSLARRYNITVDAIIAANQGIDPDRLQIGQGVCIPVTGGQPPPTPEGCPVGSFPYIIRPHDNYYRLAQQFGTTIQAIVAANPGVDPNRLQIGQQICVPVPSVPGICPGGAVPYRISFGDTLYAISLRFGTTVEVIMSANPGLNPYRLRVGQWICLPAPAAGPILGPLPRTPFRPPFGPPMRGGNGE